MFSRHLFICLYFSSFFVLNRWYDVYEYYMHFSKQPSIVSDYLSAQQLSTKQLQHVLNLRGLSYVQIHEKSDLVHLVEETGDYINWMCFNVCDHVYVKRK